MKITKKYPIPEKNILDRDSNNITAGYNLALEDIRKEINEKKKLWKRSRIARGLCLDCKKPLYSANYCFDHTIWRNKSRPKKH